MSFQLKAVLAVAVLVLTALGAIFLLSGGDEGVIEDLIEGGVLAAKKGDAQTVIGLISRDYQAGDEDYDAVVARIRRVVDDPRAKVASLAGVHVTVHGDEAEASFTLEGRISLKERRRVQIFLRLKREGESWKVVFSELRRASGP